MLQQNGIETAPGAHDGDPQLSHISTSVGDELAQLESSLKRKRSMPPQPQEEYGASHLGESAEQEVARLRAENALQADRIRQLEATVAMNAEETQRLKETISLWAQHNGGSSNVHDEQLHRELVQQQEEHQQFAPQEIAGSQLPEQQHQQSEQQHAEQQLAEQQQHEGPQYAEQQHRADPLVEQHTSMMEDVRAALTAQDA
jgi:hypothetical protein